jgi:hypothetical protein
LTNRRLGFVSDGLGEEAKEEQVRGRGEEFDDGARESQLYWPERVG